LAAINRIAQTTSYQGRNMLDGTLGYAYTEGTNYSTKVNNLSIDQATLGTASSMDVNVNVTTAAQQAQLETNWTTTGVKAAYQAITNEGTLTITAPAVGTTYNNMNVVFATGTAVASKYETTTNTLTITVNNAATAGGLTLTSAIKSALTATEKYTGGVDKLTTLAFVGTANIADGSTLWNTANDSPVNVAAVAASAEAATKDLGIMNVTAKNAGAAGNVLVKFATGALNVALVGTTLTITAPDTTALSTIATYVTNNSNFTMTVVHAGTYSDTNDTALKAGFNLANGADAKTAIASTSTVTGSENGFPADVTFRLTGDTGSQVYSFTAGEDVADIVNAINLQSDSTGITAATHADTPTLGQTYLTFDSTDYGTNAKVAISVISGGTAFKTNMKDRTGTAALATTGTDVVATVNGQTAKGNGNVLSLNTPVLSMSMEVKATQTGTIGFTIDGGGAQFQLGANINTNNQANIGIQSVDTGSLGGTNGLLYEIAPGGGTDLTSGNLTKAAAIVNEALDQITSLSGRLGGFQKETLQTNQATLTSTVTALTNSQSTIQDADFAAETANLTRAQILVQSGTAVLKIANKNPENVLTLLQ